MTTPSLPNENMSDKNEVTAAAAATAPAPAVPVKKLPTPRITDKSNRSWEYWESPIGFSGYVQLKPIVYPEGEATMLWSGGKISLDVWNQVCAFFEWTQDQFKSEAQVRLYYNKVTRKWGAWAYPQQPSGMTTKELEDHADFAPQRAQFGADWVYLGTIHHHCTMSAFQSGTDRANEELQDGIHITIGDISKNEYSLHGRLQVRGQEYGCNWHQWFEMPVIFQSPTIPVKLRLVALDYYLKSPPPTDCPFPEQWKTNCHKQVFVGYGGPSGSQGYHANDLRPNHLTNGASGRVPVLSDLKTQFVGTELQFMTACVSLMRHYKTNHNRADFILFEEKDATKLNKEDTEFNRLVQVAAEECKVSAPRVNQMFDCWDFEFVLTELKINVPEIADVKEAPAPNPVVYSE